MSQLRPALMMAFLISWLPFPAQAQDHLQPESSELFAYSLTKMFGDYYRALRKELLTIDEEPYVAAMEIPGFSPEWALFLGSGASGRARLEVRRAKASIWYRLQEQREASFWRRLLNRNEPSGFAVYEQTVGPITARAIAGA